MHKSMLGVQSHISICAGTGADMGKADTAAWLLKVAIDAHRGSGQALLKDQAHLALQTITTAMQVLDAPRDVQVVVLGDSLKIQCLANAAADKYDKNSSNLVHRLHCLVLLMQLGTGHIWRMRLLEAQLRAAMAAGNQWDVALAAAECLTPFYRSVYPKVGPVVFMSFKSIGFALLFGQRLVDGNSCEHLPVTFRAHLQCPELKVSRVDTFDVIIIAGVAKTWRASGPTGQINSPGAAAF